jgi:hypothetical protein
MRTAAPPWLTHEAHAGRPSRRFETATLRVVLPLFAAYLALTTLTPFLAPTAWSGALSLAPRGELEGAALYRALEQIAAFTLLGYAIAEYHGRSHETFRPLARSVLAWAAPTSLVLQWIRGWHPEHGASGVLFLLTLAGAVGGAWLYVLQLQHVQALGARVARSAT